MSQRAYQPQIWGNAGDDRNYPVSTNRAMGRGFPSSATHPDDIGFIPSRTTTITPELYNSGPRAPFGPVNQVFSASITNTPPNRANSITEVGSNFRGIGHHADISAYQGQTWPTPINANFGPIGSPGASRCTQTHADYEPNPQSSPGWEQDSPRSRESSEYLTEGSTTRLPGNATRSQGKGHSQRRPSNRDEFDGPHQFLDRPSTDTVAAQERDLPHVPTNLFVQEQDDVLSQVNDRLSQCAFDFVAKYQFPIPLEADKRPVSRPADREWTEWVYLLKRLATKRRIPARVLYNGQIKQLVTVLENSLEMRHAAKNQSRPLKDDRNVLQLISAGIQVAKILKDAATMEYLDGLYLRTERVIQARRNAPGFR